jgi:hypothetical protein
MKADLLERRLAAWEKQWPAEVQKKAKHCLDEFAKQVPSKVELQQWDDRLAQFDAARDQVEALIQRVDQQQEHLEALSVDELKKLLERFVEEMNGRLEGHSRDFQEAAHARQSLLERIGALEVKLQNNTVDAVPDNELRPMQAHCTTAVRKDLAWMQRVISAELRAESHLCLTEQQWAIATLDERIALTDQRLSRRIDELLLALRRGRQHQQAQVAKPTALEGLVIGDASTLETPAPIISPVAHSAPTLTGSSPRRQVQFQESPGSEEAQARLSATPADDKSEVSTSE